MAEPLVELVSRGTIIGGRFRIEEKIGSGSFGEVYRGKHIWKGFDVAVKIEERGKRCSMLPFEADLYQILKGGLGIPKMIKCGTQKNFNFIVMELLGPSLEYFFNICQRRFSLKTVLMLADQMIHRLEYLHNKCFVHRDIKPENFVMGYGNNLLRVFLIDFGLAKRYRNLAPHTHIPYCDNKKLTGTARYMSRNVHLGMEQSRRDDLESLGYVIIYFLRGELPWQNITANMEKQKNEKIAETKLSTPLAMLCRDLAPEFIVYLNYCRNLAFEEEPDYQHLRYLFRKLAKTLGIEYDYVFDWCKLLSTNQNDQDSHAIPTAKRKKIQNEDNEPQNEVEKKRMRLRSKSVP